MRRKVLHLLLSAIISREQIQSLCCVVSTKDKFQETVEDFFESKISAFHRSRQKTTELFRWDATKVSVQIST